MSQETRSSSFLAKVVAVIVLAVAAWLLLKVVLSVLAGIAWAVAAVLAVLGVVWAWRTLSS